MSQAAPGNVVVTGGSGFLGTHLIRRLVHEGYSVRNIGRQMSILEPQRASEIVSEIKAFDPKFVVHLAAHQTTLHNGASIVKVLESGVVLGSIMLEAALAANATFLTTGSYWQHGPDDSSSNVFYASAKDAFHELSNFYRVKLGLSIREITLFDNYGPGDNRQKLLPSLLRATMTGEKVSLRRSDALINLTYITDVVDAIMMSLTTGNPSWDAVVRSESFIRIDDLIRTVENVSGRKLDHTFNGEATMNQIESPLLLGNLVVGWTPNVDLETGISMCLESLHR